MKINIKKAELNDFLFSQVEREIDFLKNQSDKASCSINFSQCCLIFYYAIRFKETQDESYLVQIKKIIKIRLLFIAKNHNETSFIVGPLGFIWSVFVVEEYLRITLISQDIKDKIIDDFFSFQQSWLEDKELVLDYLYGVTGWVVIVKYLNSSQRAKCLDIIKKQIFSLKDKINADLSINKVIRKNGHFELEKNRGHLGFSHGLASVYWTIENYMKDSKLVPIQTEIKKVILANYKKTKGVARNIDDQDFHRQDWCHGSLGTGFALKHQEMLKTYALLFGTQDVYRLDGICHDLGHRILLDNLNRQLQFLGLDFFPDDEVEIKATQKQLAVGFSFINSYLSVYLSQENYLDLQWWRLLYPIN